MTIRITTYLDEDTAEWLSKFENKSKIVKEALNIYLLNEDHYFREKKLIQREIKKLRYQLDTKKLELDFINEQLDLIDKKKEERPYKYNNAVNTLKCLPDVTEEDLRFQAERLNIDLARLKGLLWLDGHYDEIFKKESKKMKSLKKK